eukprot:TRINITY_DN6762_c0_g6_i1.p1 TRINITY_DN6762_c0_g6~~TRINITY_DN6762_c0_g6_i1.p1  ORF type:complete len:119 (+),score=33.06 TRINITY_DN6762_c0_g6_i1:135-491(+)
MNKLCIIALILFIGVAVCELRTSGGRATQQPKQQLSRLFDSIRTKVVRRPRSVELLTYWKPQGPAAYPKGTYPKDTSNYPFYPKSGACCCQKHPGTHDCVFFGNYQGPSRGCVCSGRI